MTNSFQMYELPEVNESIFNTSISGGTKIREGTHQVIIDNIEVTENNYGPNLKIVFKDDQDKTITQFISVLGKDKSGKQVYHWLFLNLLSAATKISVDKVAFLGALRKNGISNIKALVGFGMEITVSPAKKGYTLIKNELNDIVVKNLETDTIMFDKSFKTYDEAQVYIDTYSNSNPDKAIKRGYPQVSRINQRKDCLDANSKALQSIIEAITKANSNSNSQYGKGIEVPF